jgi:hypothetical protein
MLLIRERFSVEAIEDGATMADIDDATFWAVTLWQPDDGRTLSRVMPHWCVLASP